MTKRKVPGTLPLTASYAVKDGEAALLVVATFQGGRSDLQGEIKEILECIRQYGGVEIATLDAPPTTRTREDVTNLW